VDVTVEPATPDRWDDVAAVFGARGDPSRCWCSYLLRSPYDMTAREENRSALRGLVDSGAEPGVLAYAAGVPVGWASVGPRERYLDRLTGSPVLRPVPGEAVWSVLCFVVPRPHRGQGVASALLAGAVEFARERGADAVEGCRGTTRAGSAGRTR
jgi:GNAT superfamily N-acetyltransferase